jgi:hypothetical protein
MYTDSISSFYVRHASGMLINDCHNRGVGSYSGVGGPWVSQVGRADCGCGYAYAPGAISTINGCAFTYQVRSQTRSTSLSASTGNSWFLPVYHWSKCGLEGKKKWGGHGLPGRCASYATVQ